MKALDDMTREELIAYARQLEERLAEEGIGVATGMPDWLTIEGDTANPDAKIVVSAIGSAPAPSTWGIIIQTEDGSTHEITAPIGEVITLPMDGTLIKGGPR